MKKLICVLALGSAFISIDVMAWGNDGHRVVGAMADQLIQGSHAQKQVEALLLPGESLEKIANWADCVKGTYCGPQTPEMIAYVTANPKHGEYHYTDIPFQVAHYHDGAVGSADDDIVQTLKQAIAVLQGKADDSFPHLQCAHKLASLCRSAGQWHAIEIPSSAPSPLPPAGEGESSSLREFHVNPHHFTQRQALLLIVHLVGDIHQPLHVGAAYVGKNGQFVVPETAAQIDGLTIFDARGGNNFLLDDEKLTASSAALIPPAAPKEGVDVKPAAPVSITRPFHSYWDSTVVDYAMHRVQASTPAQFAQIVIAGQPDVGRNSGDPFGWPTQWADDALQVSKLAHADVVLGQISEQTGRNGDKYKVWALHVPHNYPVPSSALAKEQLIKGGYHLAALLQAIWP